MNSFKDDLLYCYTYFIRQMFNYKYFKIAFFAEVILLFYLYLKHILMVDVTETKN